jgi:hypothetical protein
MSGSRSSRTRCDRGSHAESSASAPGQILASSCGWSWPAERLSHRGADRIIAGPWAGQRFDPPRRSGSRWRTSTSPNVRSSCAGRTRKFRSFDPNEKPRHVVLPDQPTKTGMVRTVPMSRSLADRLRRADASSGGEKDEQESARPEGFEPPTLRSEVTSQSKLRRPQTIFPRRNRGIAPEGGRLSSLGSAWFGTALERPAEQRDSKSNCNWEGVGSAP